MSKSKRYLQHQLKIIPTALILAWLLFLALSSSGDRPAYAGGSPEAWEPASPGAADIGDLATHSSRPMIQSENLATFYDPALLPLIQPTNLITLDIGTLPFGKALTITFDAVITDPLPVGVSQVCNQATITGDGINTVTDDPGTAASNDETCTSTPQASLSVSKTDSADPVLPNAGYSYVVTVTNSGPSAAENVVVTDNLPVGVIFASTNGCNNDLNGVPTCNLGMIASSASVSYTIVVTAPGVAQTATNVVTVTTTTYDPDTSNNSVSEDTQIQLPGTIIIEKLTNPAALAGTFTFTDDIEAPNNFNLTHGQTQTFTNVISGSYTVTEQDPSGTDFGLSDITCDDANSSGNVPSRTATINVESGETVRCSFTNIPEPGTVIIEKITVPAGVPDSFDFTHTIAAPNNFSLTHAMTQTFTITPGNYSVTEANPAALGYDLTGLTCIDSASNDSSGNVPSRMATINVDPGETVTCVFTNTARPGNIIIQKITEPSSATESFTFTHNITSPISFNLAAGGTQNFNNTTVGTYTVSENDPTTAPGGYDLTGLSCDDANSTEDVGSRTATITLDPDETVTCVFTNSRRGSITIIKSSNPVSPTNFTFNGSGSLGSFTLDDAGGNDGDAFTNTITFGDLTSGSYTVTEDPPAEGYSLTNISCDDGASPTPSSGDTGSRTATINLDAGEDVTCTFSNSRTQDIYLPVLLKGFDPSAARPDLVIDSLVATSSGVTVTIRNTSPDASVNGPFWVDVYFNPNPAPPGFNQPWESIAPAGLVWGVTNAVSPGETLQLTFNGPYFGAGSRPFSLPPFPVGAQVYGYVDSLASSTVAESNEGNNLFGPVTSGP